MTLDKRKLNIQMAKGVLTYAELCKKADIHTSTLNRILNGVQVPTPATIGKLARALSVPVSEIIKED